MLARGTVQVFGVDKFPRMTDYVVPPGVRIADADRVRLGAHLASGTTVMHEGFVNFNAGTLGTSMVEGRISQGVVVGDGSDIGGGASTMGTLSGGGTERVSIGERCLLGAESGLGIALGDDCVVEAGLYVTAGTKVTLPDGTVTKARELSGQSNLLFLRNSVTGAVEARPATGTASCSTPRSTPTTDRDAPRHRPRHPTTTDEGHPPHAAHAPGRHHPRRGGAPNTSPPPDRGGAGRRRARGDRDGRRARGAAPAHPGVRRAVPRHGIRLDLLVGARPGEQRRRDHRHRGAARDAAAGRDDRDRDRDAGVEGAQREVRRPRLARAVPAAALAGLGHRRADPRPRVLDEQVLRRPRQDQGLPVDGHRRRRRRRCSGRPPARPTPSTSPRRG